MKNLDKVSQQEQLDFINSFDYVFSDMDGVIWIKYKELPDAANCMESLKALGKSVHFVTNNDTLNTTSLSEKLEMNNFKGYTSDDIAQPTVAMVNYLKKLKFDRKIYIAAASVCRDTFQKAGFKLAEMPSDNMDENLDAFVAELDDDKDVGCVVVSLDLKLSLIKLQKCLTYLKRKDCIWIVGPLDKRIPIGLKGPIVGLYHFVAALKEISGRDYVFIGKPSREYNQFLEEKFNVSDSGRVLFIGDTIHEDMQLATNGGYKKLLVLTGITNMDEVQNWPYSEELKPDYYIDSLETFNAIIKKCSS